jgi:hypothetical protein
VYGKSVGRDGWSCYASLTYGSYNIHYNEQETIAEWHLFRYCDLQTLVMGDFRRFVKLDYQSAQQGQRAQAAAEEGSIMKHHIGISERR